MISTTAVQIRINQSFPKIAQSRMGRKNYLLQNLDHPPIQDAGIKSKLPIFVSKSLQIKALFTNIFWIPTIIKEHCSTFSYDKDRNGIYSASVYIAETRNFKSSIYFLMNPVEEIQTLNSPPVGYLNYGA